jgi:hypothetical protein
MPLLRTMTPMIVRSWAVAVLGALALAGCVPTSVSNLTPRTVPANPTRTYPFEVTWNTARRGVKTDAVSAWVVIDGVLYPMTRVPVAANRWEALVPVPAGRTYVPYKYRFDYSIPGVVSKTPTSEWSQEYRLVVPPQ